MTERCPVRASRSSFHRTRERRGFPQCADLGRTRCGIEPLRFRHVRSEDLAGAIQEAVNAAIDAHNEQATVGLPGVPPLAELSRTLDEVTDTSRRAMAESAQAMREALAGVQRVSDLHRRRAAG
ncbi:hypothetical protein [Actinopolymorpha cephalotaxi]|uniref:PE family protein n=1 Tax=Actinopolymorpha cephalotaxi TaxID=504797 RepID=A0ABX2RZX9_9ACTN|nr:hypothetical protein [Actinopolymorpha cephalotaxi]NYH81722.1 hypothetical protein [Actinopolymorpha cephalotaxi]